MEIYMSIFLFVGPSERCTEAVGFLTHFLVDNLGAFTALGWRDWFAPSFSTTNRFILSSDVLHDVSRCFNYMLSVDDNGRKMS